MSSILDALGKLESSSSGPAGGPPPKRPRRWLPVAAAVAVAFVAGVLATGLLRDRAAPETDDVVAGAAPDAAEQPRPVGRLVEAVQETVPPPTAPSATSPPVEETAPSFFEETPLPPTTVPPPRPTIPAPPETVPAPVPAPPPATVPAPRATVPAPPVPAAPAARPEPARRPPAPSPRPAGAPDVRVSFLLHSPAPERRSVALSLEGAGMSTVREGEYFQGVRVLEILPEAVDLEWGGVRYRVPARR